MAKRRAAVEVLPLRRAVTAASYKQAETEEVGQDISRWFYGPCPCHLRPCQALKRMTSLRALPLLPLNSQIRAMPLLPLNRHGPCLCCHHCYPPIRVGFVGIVNCYHWPKHYQCKDRMVFWKNPGELFNDDGIDNSRYISCRGRNTSHRHGTVVAPIVINVNVWPQLFLLNI